MRQMTTWMAAMMMAGALLVAGCGGGTDDDTGDVSTDILPGDGAGTDGMEPDGVTDQVGPEDGLPGDGLDEDGQIGPDGETPDVPDQETVDPGDIPPPTPEPLEIIECGDLPAVADGNCDVTMGTNSLRLQGIILGLDKVWVGGEVLVNGNGVITCVGCDCSGEEGAADATLVSCPDGLVSPGLINAHDHITYTHGHPSDWGTERFEHRHDWRKGIRGHKAIPYTGGANQMEVTWGEMRQVLSGTTSIAGSGKAPGFLRNLDKDAQEGLNQDPVFYNTFPLGDSGGKLLVDSCDYPGIDGEWVLDSECYLPHVCEGIDAETRNEFLCLSSSENGGVDLVESNSVFIHGIGMWAEDGEEMAENGTAVVWSPRTNISLYGHTAQVTMYDRQGVLLGLGTDWTYSGSVNMQRELYCAMEYNETYCNSHFTDHELWLMATAWNAMALAIGDAVGVIMPGKIADISIFKANGSTNYHRAIFEGNMGDVVLVLRAGLPLYGDADIVPSLPFGGEGCEELPDSCAEQKVICVQRETGYTFDQLADANSGNYGLYFCGVPDNEVTCTPFRAEPKGGQFDGTTSDEDRDGDGIANDQDNCPDHFNPVRPLDGNSQADRDNDGLGDMCDPCPTTPNTFDCEIPNPYDRDGDNVHDIIDNCPAEPNPGQEDEDGDFAGDACDYCPSDPNPFNTPCPGSIYDIKTGLVKEKARVQVTGVVTGVSGTSFFMQVPEDAHDAELGYTYSGIYVYVPSSNPEGLVIPQRGDYIEVSGEIENWWGQLELTYVDKAELIASNYPLPKPVFETAANVGTGGDMAEAYEGVLVLVEGEVTEQNPPAGAGDSDPTNEYVIDGALRVNDFFYLADPLPELGTQMTVMGVLRWANEDSKLEPRDEFDIIPVMGLAGMTPATVYVNEGTEETLTIPPLVVQLNTWAPEGGVEITLTSDDPERLQVPAVVTVPEFANEVAVPVVPLAGGAVPVVITATFGDEEATAEVFVIAPDTVPVPVSLLPAEAKTSVGGTVELTVTLDIPARPGGTVIQLVADDPTVVSVPESVTVPEDLFTVSFEASGLLVGSTTVTASTTAGQASTGVEVMDIPLVGLIISEVYYDAPGDDAGKEWVEIYNGTPDTIDLSGYALGNGGNDYTASVVQLAGTLAPGQCFVVGGPIADGDNGNPVFDQAIDFEPDFQNSGPKADGVALFDVAATQITNLTVPIDAVLYGDANENNLIDETGEAGEPDIGDISSGSSLERGASSWHVQPDPTPNDCTPLFVE